MQIHDVEQGSGLWMEIRAGKATASAFSDIVTPKKLEYSKSAEAYENRCVAELLTGDPIEDFKGNKWVDRGKEFEAEALAAYEFQTGKEVHKVGFISEGMFGFSPDGLIGKREEWLKGIGRGLELKAPAPQTHVGYLRDYKKTGQMPDEYKMQVQGSLWVSKFEAWDFMSYHPKLPPLIITCYPIKEVQDALTAHSKTFETNVRQLLAEIGAPKNFKAETHI